MTAIRRFASQIPTTALFLVALTGCSVAPARSPATAGIDQRPPLARVVVVNRTDRTLAISYHHAGRASAPVALGRVRPGTTAEVAPVPAEEALVFEARAEGVQRRLDPVILGTDQVWTWTIGNGTTRDP